MRFANLTHFLEAKAPNSAPWALAVASSKLLCAPNPCAVSHRMFPERQWFMVCRQQTSRSGITLVDPDNLLRVRRSFPCDALKRICSTKASVNWLWMPDASLEGSFKCWVHQYSPHLGMTQPQNVERESFVFLSGSSGHAAAKAGPLWAEPRKYHKTSWNSGAHRYVKVSDGLWWFMCNASMCFCYSIRLCVCLYVCVCMCT